MTNEATALSIIDSIPPGELEAIIEAGKEVVERRKYFEFTPLGVIFHGDAPIEVWGKAVESLVEAGQSLPILIGDMIAKGEDAYGEKYVQYLPLGYSYGTLRNWAWICRAVPIEYRVEGLSFTHLCKVASLSAEDQQHYLGRAKKEELSANELGRVLTKERQLPGPPQVLWSGTGIIRMTEEGLACILGSQGEFEVGQEVSVVISELRGF